MSFEPTDHVAVALARLPHQYRGGDAETNTQKLVRAVLSPLSELEQAARDVLFQTLTENAVGAQLEQIGELVGRPREGVTDDDIYRRYIDAQITANKSDGVREDLLTITTLVLDDEDATIVRQRSAAAVVIRIDDIAVSNEVAAVLIELLILAVSDGVRVILEYSTAPPATVARWTTQGVWGTAVWARAVDEEF